MSKPPAPLNPLETVEQVGRLTFDLLFGELGDQAEKPTPKAPSTSHDARGAAAPSNTVDTDGVSL